MKNILGAMILSFVGTAAFAGGFSIQFTWDGLKSCTSGRPNTVGNPAFTLAGVPEGTKWLYFKLTDIDVPNYRHGGGWIGYTGDTMPADVFTYKSPCPPNGVHTYEWKVTASASKDLANPLGVTAMRLDYPK
ncbi:MAG: YbhB/YbcL family Raf kinase inhibitor-like protein [Paracoccaceae bacterium]